MHRTNSPKPKSHRRSRKAGLPPGTLMHVGQERHEAVRIRLIVYDGDHIEESQPVDLKACLESIGSDRTHWINIDGVHDLALIEAVGRNFGLHPLLLEDIVNTEQRPKCEDFGSFLALIVKMLSCDATTGELNVEQVSLLLTERCVVSFQEKPGDVFDPLRERLRTARGRIRHSGADFLAYALLDSIVDNYFAVLEQTGDQLDALEPRLLSDPSRETLQTLHHMKRRLVFIRKAVWPLRESISALQRGESDLIQGSTKVYLRDVYDHCIQVIDTVETYRDMVAGMLEMYLSIVGNRMNEVMKVLTLIATIFIPLTFIAGIYGMNFDHMPELHWSFGYPLILLIMLLIIVGMLLYFRRRRWL